MAFYWLVNYLTNFFFSHLFCYKRMAWPLRSTSCTDMQQVKFYLHKDSDEVINALNRFENLLTNKRCFTCLYCFFLHRKPLETFMYFWINYKSTKIKNNLKKKKFTQPINLFYSTVYGFFSADLFICCECFSITSHVILFVPKKNKINSNNNEKNKFRNTESDTKTTGGNH